VRPPRTVNALDDHLQSALNPQEVQDLAVIHLRGLGGNIIFTGLERKRYFARETYRNLLEQVFVSKDALLLCTGSDLFSNQYFLKAFACLKGHDRTNVYIVFRKEKAISQLEDWAEIYRYRSFLKPLYCDSKTDIVEFLHSINPWAFGTYIRRNFRVYLFLVNL